MAYTRTPRVGFLLVGVMVAGLIPVWQSHAIDAGSVAGMWLFDEGNGDAVTDSAGGNDGRLFGEHAAAMPVWVDGKYGTALEFDGKSGHVMFNAAEQLERAFILNLDTDATVMFWVDVVPPPGFAILWSRGDGADTGRFNISQHADGFVGFDYRNDQGKLFPLIWGFELPSEDWNHIAITRKGNAYRQYVNGVDQGEEANDPEPDLPSALQWMISGRRGFIFNGRMDELAVFDTVLSEAEINGIMSQGLVEAMLAVSPAGKLATAWGSFRDR